MCESFNLLLKFACMLIITQILIYFYLFNNKNKLINKQIIVLYIRTVLNNNQFQMMLLNSLIFTCYLAYNESKNFSDV